MSWEMDEFTRIQNQRKAKWLVVETPVTQICGDLLYNTENALLICRNHDGLESNSLYVTKNGNWFYVTRWNVEFNKYYKDAITPVIAKDARDFYNSANEKFVNSILPFVKEA